jgi:hypothetical protein
MNSSRTPPLLSALLAAVLAIFAAIPISARAADPPLASPPAAQKRAALGYATPERAAKALYAAARAADPKALRAVLGPGSGRVIDSGDAAEDAKGRARFVAAFERTAYIEKQGNSRATLILGENSWPFPFPIVRSGRQWHFDARAGRDEVLARRIGRNELSTIEVALAYVDAQREYASRVAAPNTLPGYAQRFVSTPGRRDGLYWPATPGEAPSPMGPLFAAASDESPPGTLSAPYHGYYFRMLRAQGPNAPGGATDYVVDGRMVGGFALVAYPARYRASGVKTFVVSHDGIVYSKDLGRETTATARAIDRYDPDETWRREMPERQHAAR